MAALYEGYTLCINATQNNTSNVGIQGVELNADVDHVLVTDSSRTVTVYKVSDQKPLGSWTVKQGQTITCPAVFNTQTQEYVAITDYKVSADVFRVLSAPDCEPVVLFRHGAARFMNSLLAAPQQPIEEILSEGEVIRWSTIVKADQQLVVLFVTEQRGEHCLCFKRFNPNTLVKHRFETEPGLSAPHSFSAICRGSNIHLFYLYSNGSVYESVLPIRTSETEVHVIQALPRSLLLSLPVREGQQTLGAAVVLDETHVAVVGFPHPSAGANKDYLCIWNTHFHIPQASKEMSGMIYTQLWQCGGRLYVPHGKTLSVIPFECQKSSLAAAMGKLKQSGQSESKSCALMTTQLRSDITRAPGNNRRLSARQTNASNVMTNSSTLTVNQLTKHVEKGMVEDIQLAVGEFVYQTPQTDLQFAAGRMALDLVSRSQTDGNFYPHSAFLQLLKTEYLCYSVCPELLLLAVEKKDFSLCQIAFHLFPDIPEAITCAYLKAVLGTPDSEMDTLNLDTDSMMFMKVLTQTGCPSENDSQQNGVCLPALLDSGFETPSSRPQRDPLALDINCPVSLHKSALLNEVLQTSYSDILLLPHLKDLTVPQVTIFLQYLQFLYLKYSHEAGVQIQALRSPTMAQIVDWVGLLLDAHFTVLVMAPEAKRLVSGLHKFVRSQVKLYAELDKIEGSLQVLKKAKQPEDFALYSIKVIKLF
ncbi:nucleolar protein 11-like isoform X3 [Paramisgurnus dabryanus]|uniref:nucleolar protein 11-like isoform X3 n=1 Tax=Paramisgurnus dabryanus TaxID=90735 RepID=UPI0031F4497E